MSVFARRYAVRSYASDHVEIPVKKRFVARRQPPTRVGGFILDHRLQECKGEIVNFILGSLAGGEVLPVALAASAAPY